MMKRESCSESSFFFNETATTEICTLSLHGALPISLDSDLQYWAQVSCDVPAELPVDHPGGVPTASSTRRSEEHTSELQSRQYLVCRLLLENRIRRQFRPDRARCWLRHLLHAHPRDV